MMAKDYNNLPEWLPKHLNRLGLTVEQLANRAGISRTAIYYWLYDQCRPDGAALASVCRVLGVPYEEGLQQFTQRPRGRPKGSGSGPKEVQTRGKKK